MKANINSQEEDIILGKRFTTYLEVAVKRRKNDYYSMQYRDLEISCSMENFNMESPWNIESRSFENIPGWLVLENETLQQAIMKLNDRDLCIFWNHAVERESLAQIARDLNMPYDTVTAAYYRTLQKMKGELENNEV